MAHPIEPLTSFNYHQWKEDMEGPLHTKKLFRLTEEIEVEPILNNDKEKYFNRLDESFGYFSLSISRDLPFHIKGLKTPKEIWDKIASLFDKQDERRVHQLENELISLNTSNFETMNEFFTKFKNQIY